MRQARFNILATLASFVVVAAACAIAHAGGVLERDSASAPAQPFDWQKARQFWAFQRPVRHAPPAVKDASWVRQPMDAFVLARLNAAGLAPSEPADRRTLIRRVTFDLIGLPPTPQQVQAFVDDTSPDAYQRVVDRLLGSPQFGEHWARMWLDVARYAEDQAHIVGDNKSLFYPNAYLYRDWVIAALNDDLPYDRFIKLQLAADAMAPEGAADAPDLAALGFIGLGPKYYSRKSLDVMADEWEDRVDTVSRGLMGLTVACARCHDHKYDPITMRDYYALAGVFASTEMFNRPLDDKREKDKDGQAKKPQDALHIVREGKVADLNVFIRGDVHDKGPTVPRRFIRVLSSGQPKPFEHGSGRLDLANAIASADNPLTARVLINRVWMRYFGRALVATPSNFGKLGDRPTHPQLLDDLAVRFMAHGWSMKWLHRQIVLSATYRQASHITASAKASDAGNALLGRMSRKRLDIESWRDAVLSVCGRLDANVGGPSIDPSDPDVPRRTVYARVSRLDLNAMLAMFDFPDPNAHSAGRVVTTTPLQKLFVLNSPFMVRQADALVQRLARDAGDEDEARIRRAYLLLFARPPSQQELALTLAYLKQQPAADRDQRWAQVAQALLASNEMLYLD